MLNIFLDTNVIIDFLAERENFFEDAMQYRCAQKIKTDYIVTRNTKDFTAAKIHTRAPHDFLVEITEGE